MAGVLLLLRVGRSCLKQNSLKVRQPYTLSESHSTTFIGFLWSVPRNLFRPELRKMNLAVLLFDHLRNRPQSLLIQNLDLMTLDVDHSFF